MEKELLNLQKLFFYAVKFPRLKNIIRKAITFSPNFLFDLLFFVRQCIRLCRKREIKIKTSFSYSAFYNLKNFFTRVKND